MEIKIDDKLEREKRGALMEKNNEEFIQVLVRGDGIEALFRAAQAVAFPDREESTGIGTYWLRKAVEQIEVSASVRKLTPQQFIRRRLGL